MRPLDLRPVSAATIAAPTAADEGARQVVAAVVAAGADMEAALASAVDEQLAVVASAVEAQQISIERGTIGQLAAVDAAFAAAGDRLTAAIGAGHQRLQEAHQSEQERLATWSVEARQRLAEGYVSRTEEMYAHGVAKGDEAVSAADSIATNTGTQVDDLVTQARSAGEARAASAGGADAEAAQARTVAAREVADATASQISQSLGDTVSQLRGLGPETQAHLVTQANQTAEQIRRQLPSVAAVLSQTAEGAGSQLSQAVTAGSTTLAAFGLDFSNQLTTLQTAVIEAIRQQADAAKQSVYEAGQQAVVSGRAQHDHAAQASAALLDGILAGVANRRIRRAAAARLAGDLSGAVRQGFGDASQQARIVLAEIAQAFSNTANSVLDVVQVSTDQAQQQASDTAAHVEEALAGQATALSMQFSALVAGATGSGEGVVTGNLACLDQIIADLDTRFGQVLGEFRQTLTQQAGETSGRAREPLGTLDSRMTEAMREAEEATHRSWLDNALRSIPWGMIAGVIVGLVVTIAVVALLGTGIGALIVAGALAGALSAAATTLTDNAVHGHDTNWSELGKQMIVGAAFGAIGGAIGGGVSGALGGAVERQLLTEAGVVAIGKAANVVSGATLGVINNVVAGRPWHEGLLVNIGMSMALSYGPGGRFIENVTQNARASMVDTGNAFNVTPAEMAASSARMQARADAMSSPVETEPVAVGAGESASSEGGVRATAAPEEPTTTPGAADDATIPVEDLPEGTVMFGDRPMTEADAQVMYENARRDSPHNEVAVYRNNETGECIVVQGNNEFVDARAATNSAMREFLDSRHGEPGRWDLVEHSHPVDPVTGVTLEAHRYPSGRGGDFDVARWQSEQSGGQPVEQTIAILTERGNETVTYGYDPNDPQPYSLTYLGPDGTPVTQRFRSMEAYGEWYENQPGTGGGSPHIDGGGGASAAAPIEDDLAKIAAGIRRVDELMRDPLVTNSRRNNRAFESDVQQTLRDAQGRTLVEQLRDAEGDAAAARDYPDPEFTREAQQKLDAVRARVAELEARLRAVSEGDLPGELIVEGPFPAEPSARAAERARVEGSPETRANFRRRIAPDEIGGAPPVAEGASPGHARSGHGWDVEMQADLLNNPERVFTGTNEDGRLVDIYWRDGDIVVTIAGSKKEVITAYGKSDPDGTGKYVPVSRFISGPLGPKFVEINPRNGRPVPPVGGTTPGGVVPPAGGPTPEGG
jgi:hypothetical protein